MLQSGLFFKDQAGAFNMVSRANATLNRGNYKRANAIARSRIVELHGQVYSDVFTDKPLIDKVDLLLRFYPESYNKCLIAYTAPPGNNQPLPAPTVFQVEIISAELSVGRIQPKQANIPIAVYPYTKTKTQRHIFPSGLTEFGPITISSGIIPERAFVAMTTESAFTGNVREHRLAFQVRVSDKVSRKKIINFCRISTSRIYRSV